MRSAGLTSAAEQAPLVQALEGILRVQKAAAEGATAPLHYPAPPDPRSLVASAGEGAAARKALARYQSKRDDAAQAVEGALAAAREAHVPAADGGDSCDDMGA